MKKLKHKALLMLFMIIGSIAISSCDDNDGYYLFDNLTSGSWEVDLGENDGPDALISIFNFYGDGLGIEYVETFDGLPIRKNRFRWRLSNDYYANYLELRYMDVSRNEYFDELSLSGDIMRAVFYFDRYGFDNKVDGLSVKMQHVFY